MMQACQIIASLKMFGMNHIIKKNVNETYTWEDIDPDEQRYRDFRRRNERWTDWNWNRKAKDRSNNHETHDYDDYEFNGYMFLYERTIKITMQEAAQGLTKEYKIPHPLRKYHTGSEKLSASVVIKPGIEDNEVLQ